ncbi:MAG: ScyD/ScyE family protein [Nocardioidaceae bacterium]
MHARTRRSAGALALVTAVGALGAVTTVSPASAQRAPSATVVARGLDGPFGLKAIGRSAFVVAENVSGQVTRVGPNGGKRVLFSGAAGVAGVAASRHHVYAVLGGGDETGPPPAAKYPASSVLQSDPAGHHVRVIADLARYELRHNPDGQRQFDANGNPYDALSNPFSMTLTRYGLLVADGGANDVLRVNPRTGHVSTFFVPPTVKDVRACLKPGAQANAGTVGCDPVPTGIAVANGSVYVSTLGAEVPNAGRVYKLDPRTGRVQHVWKRLTAPTGIAVGHHHGAIYLSEVLFGAPAAAPPPNFDPSTVGRLTRIWNGRRTHSQVTMPTGLVLKRGRLFASAWSIASFLGIEHAGQIVRVNLRSFH